MHQPYATEHMNKCKYGDFMSEQTNSMSPPYGIASTWMRALSWQTCVPWLGWVTLIPHTVVLQTCLPSFYPPKFSVWLYLHARSKSQNFVGQLGEPDRRKPEADHAAPNLRPDSTSGLSEAFRCFHSSTSMDPSCEVYLFQGSGGSA